MTTIDTAALRRLLAEATPGPWRRIAHGGASTITSAVEPARNDTRIPGYSYRDEEYCIAYPSLEDLNGGRRGEARWDFVCFAHRDAELIVAVRNALPALLDAYEAIGRVAAHRGMTADDLIEVTLRPPVLAAAKEPTNV